MTNQIHYLKTESRFFDAVAFGTKTFELREEDEQRRFRRDDIMVLREIDYTKERTQSGKYELQFTGREIVTKITYVLADDEEEGRHTDADKRVPLGHLRDMLGEDAVIIGFQMISIVNNYADAKKAAR